MEGVKVEIFPSSLTLPRGTEQSQFALVIIPHEVGLVTVLGNCMRAYLKPATDRLNFNPQVMRAQCLVFIINAI